MVVDIQDVGSRYFNYTKDVFKLMQVLKELKDDAPSLYVANIFFPFVSISNAIGLSDCCNNDSMSSFANFDVILISYPPFTIST